MGYVHTFLDVTPPAREDAVPWAVVRIEESAAETGPFGAIDTQPLSPVDTNPSIPVGRDLTTDDASLVDGWFRFVFLDAALNESAQSASVHSPAYDDDPHYFTIEELRDLQDVGDAYTDDQIAEVRAVAEEAFEHAVGRAFVPRTATVTLDPTVDSLLRVPYAPITSVTGATIDDVDADLTGVYVRGGGGFLYRSGGWGYNTLTLTITYGETEPPLAVKRAVMILARVWLTERITDVRAVQRATDEGPVFISLPGRRGDVFGIPEVDSAVREYGVPAVA